MPTIHDLGTLGGSSSHGLALSSAGHAVGRSFSGQGGLPYAFLCEPGPGPMRDLGVLTAGEESEARAVNAQGWVVGLSGFLSQGRGRAFLWTRTDGMRALPLPEGHNVSAANAIDEVGNIVGFTGIATGRLLACVWRGFTKAITLSGLPAGNSEAFGIGADGTIVGSMHPTGGQADLAFVRLPAGLVRPLPGLGGRNGRARAVNAGTLVVGMAENAAGSARPVLWTNGVVADIGLHDGSADGEAFWIDRHGRIAGTDRIAGATGQRAFLRTGGVTADLNAGIPPGTLWVLERAVATNDAGWIVGTGIVGGITRAFLRQP